jgi:hypothetical protein
MNQSILRGAIGFGLTSLCVFATVAFAESWMYKNLTVMGAYLAWTILFIVLGAFLLGRLVVHQEHRRRFYLLFVLAFFAYSAGWICAYFILRGSAGEWVGSIAGSILMALILAIGFSITQSTIVFAVILFAANSIGYFAGSTVNNAVQGMPGMLFWGVIYGLCLGAGLGAVLHLAQTRSNR